MDTRDIIISASQARSIIFLSTASVLVAAIAIAAGLVSSLA